jgi:hypothetical protein
MAPGFDRNRMANNLLDFGGPRTPANGGTQINFIIAQ